MEALPQREFTRVPIQIQAEVIGGGLTFKGTSTRNLSMKGVFVACSERLPEGTECQINLLLADGAIKVQIEGIVAHDYAEGVAFQFTRILGAESFEHLQKLVLYNAPDPELVENEFNTSLGIHRKGGDGLLS
jgi:hypothetical protein